MDFELGKLVKLPRGTPTLEPLQLEMGDVFSIESRIADIATVTKTTAPELMKTFIEGHQILNRYLSQVSFEYNQACTNADKRKAVVTLDLTAGILQEKGLATAKNPMGSEDLRKAVLMQDNEYLNLLERINALEAAHEWLKGKLKSFDMAYRSVKNIYYADDSESFNHQLRGGFSDLKDNYIIEGTNNLIGTPKY